MDLNLNPPLYMLDAANGFPSDSALLGMSLEEMIDSDIKAEFDDISCGNSSGNFANVDSLDLVNEQKD
jgi:hypothetical protein